MSELRWKPCPFCGGTDIRWNRHVGAGSGMWHHGQDVFSMCCYDCGGTVPNRYSLELVNEAWNRRPQEANAPAKGSEPFERWRKELRACIVQLLYVAHESKSPKECKAHPYYSSVMNLVDGGPELADPK